MLVFSLFLGAAHAADVSEDPAYRSGIAVSWAGFGLGVGGHLVGLVGTGMSLGAVDDVEGTEIQYDVAALRRAQQVQSAGNAMYAVGGPLMGLGGLQAASARSAKRTLPLVSLGLGVGGMAVTATTIALTTTDPDPTDNTLTDPAALVGAGATALLAGSYVTGMWALVENRAAADVSHRPIETGGLRLDLTPVAGRGFAGGALHGRW